LRWRFSRSGPARAAISSTTRSGKGLTTTVMVEASGDDGKH
jgi:hypothetical protein